MVLKNKSDLQEQSGDELPGAGAASSLRPQQRNIQNTLNSVSSRGSGSASGHFSCFGARPVPAHTRRHSAFSMCVNLRAPTGRLSDSLGSLRCNCPHLPSRPNDTTAPDVPQPTSGSSKQEGLQHVRFLTPTRNGGGF